MDIKELHSFKMSDAVKFHDKLNPNLWRNNHLDPAVRKQLIVIAEDFLSNMGISGLDVKDITVSGSSAAYSYTPHSDLDLHILVDMSKLPNDEVYRELFNAKKTIYNDSHDIKVKGVPVELYVQDSNEPVVSLGEYSILNDKWLKIPSKRRANLDQNATKAKYDKLAGLVDLALKSRNLERVKDTIKTIKRYRQAGLDKFGEFGPENLAYKAVRSQGAIDALYKLRDELHGEELSIEEMYSGPKMKFLRPGELKGSYSDYDLLRMGFKKSQNGSWYIPQVKWDKLVAAQQIGEEEELAERYAKEFEDYDPNGVPPGPEFKPTMPAGTVKVDVSDTYDWYKLGQHISNLKGLGKHDFGKGPPSTIMAFGDEDTEHKYIQDLEKTGLTTTDIDPVDPNQPKGMKRQKVDPTYNVKEDDTMQYAASKTPPTNPYGGMTDRQYRGSISEIRTNPDRNKKHGSGKYELINYAEDNIRDTDNWAVSMTMEPKLGINPQAAVSEDTPKGIYFYPLNYFKKLADRDELLPWGDNFPYLQLFQYDRSGEMTQQTQVDPNKLKQALLQYCPEEVIQQASEEGDYDGTPYWFIYDCLSRLGKSDETNVIRWNKVLRDLGFTSVYDPGNGWIAHNEPTQGVVLDPRIIKQHKMFVNRNPTLQNRRYDIQGLADSIGWSSYFQRESHLQRVYNHPDEKKVRLDVAKTMLRPFLGKTSEEAKEMGYDKALKAAADKVIEILKNTINEASDYSQYEIDAIKFTQEPYEGWNGMGAMITAYADGNQVGQVIFEPTDNDKSKWYATEVEVEDDFQRRGIATTMYDMAKKIAQKANAVIVPSNSQTSDAKGMWKDKKVWEASGYIPSAKEKNDPRFKTALTKDVRPDAIKKNAKAFGFKTSRAGIPPQARADGKV